MNQTIEINLEDKEKAKEQVELVQKSFDELLDVIETYKKEVKHQLQMNEQAATHIKDLEKGLIQAMDIIQNTHMILQSKAEDFKLNEDQKLKGLLDTLSIFVLSPTTIKMRVMKNNAERNSDAN